MANKDRQVSRRGFFSSLLRDAARLAWATDEEKGGRNEVDPILADFESLPIVSTYPWELFEDEAKRMGIDYEKIGKVEAIKRIIAYQMKHSPPDAETGNDNVNPQFRSSVHVDPVTDICAVLDTVFRIVIPSESARKMFSIKGISEKCSGHPGWYLWFEDKPGAYLLELVEAESHEAESGEHALDHISGYFQIKYYPDVLDTRLFETFSLSEQVTRKSSLFDTSGTPVFDADSEMHESLFATGRLDVSISTKENRVEFTLSAPDHWITWHSRGYKITDQRGVEREVLSPGEIDRNVPSWELSWWVFDRLISAFCYAKRAAPAVVAVFSKPGRAFEVNGNHVVAKETKKQSVTELISVVLFTLKEEVEEQERFDFDRYVVSLQARELLKQAALIELQPGWPSGDAGWINDRWWHFGQEEIVRENIGPC